MGQLELLFNKHKYDRSIVTNSRGWFNKEAASLAGMHADRVLREGGKQTKLIEPGSMYMFYYSPKYKETLPYYDTFPLLLPYAETNNGFIGLNLHYLPPYYRVKLLDGLMKYATNDKLNRNTKLKYTWDLVRSAAYSKLGEATIHRYIAGNVKSNFVKIEPKNWFSACMLPVARFKKMSESQVWKDSMR